MSMFRMKSMLAIGVVFTALLSTFSSIFEGRVVAKLPFIPISWITGLSHRNLIGIDAVISCFSQRTNRCVSRRRLHGVQLHLPLHSVHDEHSSEHPEDP